MKELLIILGLATVIIFIILLATGVVDNIGSKKGGDNSVVKSSPKNTANYITPAEFSVGFVQPTEPKYMNNCSPNVLYPIDGLGPDYGSKMPDNCRCTEFVQAP